MNDSLRFSLIRLISLQKEIKEKAQNTAFDDRVRAAYSEVSANLSTALAEVEYLLNLG